MTELGQKSTIFKSFWDLTVHVKFGGHKCKAHPQTFNMRQQFVLWEIVIFTEQSKNRTSNMFLFAWKTLFFQPKTKTKTSIFDSSRKIIFNSYFTNFLIRRKFRGACTSGHHLLSTFTATHIFFSLVFQWNLNYCNLLVTYFHM